MSAETPSGVADPRLASSSQAQVGVFSRNGDYWTIGLGTTRFPIKDFKGLGYIQRLLQNPGKEFHALDLLNYTVGGAPASDTLVGAEEALPKGLTIRRGLSGDSGEMLDPQAKRDYSRRIEVLKEKLEDQRERGNHERADEIEEELEEEIKALTREMARGVGLGGRDRRTGSNAERARLNVTRAIKTALEKIAECDRTLGEWLDAHIYTGIFCRYANDVEAPLAWQFTVSVGSQAAQLPEASGETTAFQLVGSTLMGSVFEQTTFVGREHERTELHRVLDEVRSGSRRVVMIAGHAGVGKTRIAIEFARQAEGEGVLVLAGACYDRDDSVPFVPFVEIFESALTQHSDRQTLWRILDAEAPEIARLVPQLRRSFPDMPPPIEVSPQQTRRILFQAVASVLTRLTKNQPLLLVLDDLQWADEGTLSLLDHIARSLPTLPLMVVGTYRDNQLDADGPLPKLLSELTRIHVLAEVNLSGLNEKEVGAMLEALSGREVPSDFVKVMFTGAEGNPFFVGELFHHLNERGKIFDSQGSFRRDLRIDDLGVPKSLQLVIGSRLARLSTPTREMLGAAAVIGPSFAFELLQGSLKASPDAVLDQIEEAERAGVLAGSLVGSESRFQFFHELVRQTALTAMSAPRRQLHHFAIANAMEKIYADNLDEHANDLAYHLLHAGNSADPERTVKYLSLAAKRSLSQSSYHSALQHLRNALNLIPSVPDSPARSARELELQMDRGIAVLATAGWHVAEYLDAISRARDLCLALAKEDRLLEVLFALRFSHLEHGEHRRAREDADELMRKALKINDTGMLVAAYWAVGSSQFYMGEFSAAHANLENGISLYDFDQHKNLLNKLGQDPCMSCLCHDAQALWTLGYPDRAEQRAQQSLALSKKLDHSYTLAYCLSNLAIDCLVRHEYSRVLQYAKDGMAISRKPGFDLAGASYRAYAYAAEFALRRRTDLAKLREVALRPVPEYQLISTCFRSTLAEAFGAINDFETAFALLAQANELMEQNDERFVEPELHRIRGDLLLNRAAGRMEPLRSADSQAESEYRKAIEVARAREAKMFELRATISLSRLLMQTDRRGEAAQILESCCSWFTEGFNTAELQTAHSMLTSLGARL